MLYNRAVTAHGALFSLLFLCNCGITPPASPQDVPKAQRQTLTSSTDTSQFNFEAGTQNWGTDNGGCPNCSVQWVGSGNGQAEAAPTFLGKGSLKFHIDSNNGSYYQAQFYHPQGIAQGDTISFAVWLPPYAQGAIAGVQPYLKNYAASNGFDGYYLSGYFEPQDGWVVITMVSPYDSVDELGVLFNLSGSFSNNVYIDSVDW